MATLLGRFATIALRGGLRDQSGLRQVNLTNCRRWRLYSFGQAKSEFPHKPPQRGLGFLARAVGNSFLFGFSKSFDKQFHNIPRLQVLRRLHSQRHAFGSSS
jgi:hypothetical protein